MKKITFERDDDTGLWYGLIDGESDLIIHLCNFCGVTGCESRDLPAPCHMCEEFKQKQTTAFPENSFDQFVIESGLR